MTIIERETPQLPTVIRIGTRQSRLALAQADIVIDRLQQLPAFRHTSFEIVPFITTGDKFIEVTLDKIGGKDIFTKEIDQALQTGDIDIAVHSLKDLPYRLGANIALSAVLDRQFPLDIIVANKNQNLLDLPSGSIIGTSSLRRQSQILHRRPDLKIRPIRGNIHTRIKKWQAGLFDALILAEAGVKRADIDIDYNPIDATIMVPACGQGSLGLTTRADDHALRAALTYYRIKNINNDTPSCDYATSRIERKIAENVGATCRTPIGIYAHITQNQTDNPMLDVMVYLGNKNGQKTLVIHENGPVDDATSMVIEISKKLLHDGQDIWDELT